MKLYFTKLTLEQTEELADQMFSIGYTKSNYPRVLSNETITMLETEDSVGIVDSDNHTFTYDGTRSTFKLWYRSVVKEMGITPDGYIHPDNVPWDMTTDEFFITMGLDPNIAPNLVSHVLRDDVYLKFLSGEVTMEYATAMLNWNYTHHYRHFTRYIKETSGLSRDVKIDYGWMIMEFSKDLGTNYDAVLPHLTIGTEGHFDWPNVTTPALASAAMGIHRLNYHHSSKVIIPKNVKELLLEMDGLLTK